MKVAVIGGGSTYTPELVNGFLTRVAQFPLDELWLMDIDQERLKVVGGVAQRMVEFKGSPFKVVLTTDQREAVSAPEFPLAVGQEHRLPAGPRLQRFPANEIFQFRTGESEYLNSYGWIDRNAGTVHIPIADAMRMGVAQGILRSDMDPTDMARAFLAFENGAIQQWLASPKSFSLKSSAESFADILIAGLKK